jgi:phosphoglycerate dehydrogenase-like enzyme
LGDLQWVQIPDSAAQLHHSQLAGIDAVLVGAASVNSESFHSPETSPLLIARFGVGYDSVDLGACDANGVAVTITSEGSMRPVSTAALTLLLGTLYRLPQKDEIARGGHWDRRLDGLGRGLSGLTVGCIGFGNVAQDFVKLLQPFDVNVFAYDPFAKEGRAKELNVTLVELEELCRVSDAVVVLAALTSENRGMIGAAEFELMKPNTVLINISRGPLVVHADLVDALTSGKIWGAGLDVFELEPPDHNDPIFSHPNVVVAPHNLAWTTALAAGMGRSALQGVVEISRGAIPRNVVNPSTLECADFLDKLQSHLQESSHE